MFPSMLSCASVNVFFVQVSKNKKKRSNNYDLVTNMATVGHLRFYLSHFRNHCTDLNETWLLCSPYCLVVQAPKKFRYVDKLPGGVARSDAGPPGMGTVTDSILTSGKHSFLEI